MGNGAEASAARVTPIVRAAAALVLIAAATGACRPRSEVARACSPDATCGAGAYCAFDPQLCGKGARPGVCRPIPARCDSRAPVCACDGTVYPNECAAYAARIDLDVTGGCRTDVPDFIHCGPRFCDAKTHYCEIYLSDVLEPPPDYECKPLPGSCVPGGGKAPSCDCFPPETPCLAFCGPVQTGGVEGVHLTCQGKKKPSL
jgi:hypothetical protein